MRTILTHANANGFNAILEIYAMNDTEKMKWPSWVGLLCVRVQIRACVYCRSLFTVDFYTLWCCQHSVTMRDMFLFTFSWLLNRLGFFFLSFNSYNICAARMNFFEDERLSTKLLNSYWALSTRNVYCNGVSAIFSSIWHTCMSVWVYVCVWCV